MLYEKKISRKDTKIRSKTVCEEVMDKMKARIFIICLSILVGLPEVFVFGETGKRTYTYATKEDKTGLVNKESNNESYTNEKDVPLDGQVRAVDPLRQSELPRETKIGQKAVIQEKEGDDEAYTEERLPETRIDEKTGKEIKIISSDDIPLVSEYRMKEEGEE